MSRRELIKKIIAREKVERCGFWLGMPHADLWPILHRYFGTATEEELRVKLGDDCRWICPQFYDDAYQDPQGRQLFDEGLDRAKHMAPPLVCVLGAHAPAPATVQAKHEKAGTADSQGRSRHRRGVSAGRPSPAGLRGSCNSRGGSSGTCRKTPLVLHIFYRQARASPPAL